MASQTSTILLDDKLCLTAQDAYDGEGKANSYWCPVGPEPGVAYVYLLDADFAAVDLSEPHRLSFKAGKTVTFPKLWIDTAIAASGGPIGDGKRARLVRLVDSRHHLGRFTTVNKSFNVHCPAPPSLDRTGSDPEEFYANSLNESGGVCSWDDVARLLWQSLPAALVGAYPGLPVTPGDVPQNLRYEGVSAWHALHDVLRRLNCTTSYDPKADAFSIIDKGADQIGLAGAQYLNPRYESNGDPQSNPGAHIPETIRVYFHRQSEHYGTEPETDRDVNWSDFGAETWLDVPTNVLSAVGGTMLGLHDDMPCIVAFDGTFSNADAMTARAAERAARWVAEALNATSRSYVTYQGIAPEFSPGSKVASVWWKDLGDGFLTEVDNYPGEPQSPFEGGGRQRWHKPSANFREADFARHTAPVYPRNLQLIQITNRAPDELGYYSAVVVRRSPDTSGPTPREKCLALEATGNAVRRRETCGVYFGRLNGTATNISGEVLPLYLLESGAGQILLGKAVSGIANKQTGTLELWDGPAGSETLTVPVQIVQLYNTGPAIKTGDFVWFTNDCSGPRRLPTSSPAVLGKVQDDPGIGNKQSGTINVYGGTPGSENQQLNQDGSNKTLAVYNKFHGYLPKDAWVIAQDDGDGYYVTDTIQGDHLVARVAPPSPGEPLSIHDAPTQLEVEILPNDQAVTFPSPPITVNAFARLFPPVDGERLIINWTGSIFTIVTGEYDFLWAKLATSTATFDKGETVYSVLISTDGGDTFPMTLNAAIFNALGSLGPGKIFTIRRVNTTNQMGLGHLSYSVVSAEC